MYAPATDMRKGFDGLSGIVSGQLKRDPANGDVFIFVNRARNKIKLLHWEAGGFVLYYKRLESGTFDLPVVEGSNHAKLKWSDLVMMVEGIKLEKYSLKKRFSFIQG
ncbi:IS66 family insertion sequence element accessory protein TnpB [Saccharicrinis carchari]|nr:IS66 family insertion sequence element accessory protein TnpB [Saccharicrinis carchari]